MFEIIEKYKKVIENYKELITILEEKNQKLEREIKILKGNK